MELNQVGISILMVFAVGFSTAQQSRLGAFQAPSDFQPMELGNLLPQVNVVLPPQQVQSGNPAVIPLGLQVQNPSDAQVQQPGKKLTWRFPAAPRIPTRQAPVNVVRQAGPVPVQGIMVTCNETAVKVVVREDSFGLPAAVNIAALTLGGCAAKGMDASSQVLIYESSLHGCNSKLTVTANELVYAFTLSVSPVPLSGTPILRRAGAKVLIECHYLRFHNVSSNALMPAWIPFASAQAAEERLVFSLRLMMDDWVSERPSNQYYLGELINIEASVLQFNHVPLRVLVDGCVATAVPDTNSVPRYSFIESYGCLTDAKLTQSSSHFMPQTQAAKLWLQLEAFRFQQGNGSLVYIACILKATAASAPADAEHKACSFSDNRWTAAYGPDQVCSCCSSSCASRKGRDLSDQGMQLVKEVSLGPVMVLESTL